MLFIKRTGFTLALLASKQSRTTRGIKWEGLDDCNMLICKRTRHKTFSYWLPNAQGKQIKIKKLNEIGYYILQFLQIFLYNYCELYGKLNKKYFNLQLKFFCLIKIEKKRLLYNFFEYHGKIQITNKSN